MPSRATSTYVIATRRTTRLPRALVRVNEQRRIDAARRETTQRRRYALLPPEWQWVAEPRAGTGFRLRRRRFVRVLMFVRIALAIRRGFGDSPRDLLRIGGKGVTGDVLWKAWLLWNMPQWKQQAFRRPQTR